MAAIFGGPMHGQSIEAKGDRFQVEEKKDRQWFVPRHATQSVPARVEFRTGTYERDPDNPNHFLWRGWEGAPMRHRFNAEEFTLAANGHVDEALDRYEARTGR